MCLGGGDSSGALREQEAKREGLIFQGLDRINRAFIGFNQPFFNQLTGQYLANALPQVGEQYRQTRSQLGFNLANQGLIRSSAAAGLGASLERQRALQTTNVANQAVQATQELQRQIEGNKTQLISQLEASADPTAAGQQALSAATQYSAPNLLQPLGNLFQNWSNVYLARQYANANQPGISYGPRTGFYPPGTGASSYEVK